jgi:hypothetical protein
VTYFLPISTVKCFGTEDRVTETDKIIPANNITLSFVTFPGSDIKDLYVHEAPPAVVAPPPAPTPAPAATHSRPAPAQPAVDANTPPPAPVAAEKKVTTTKEETAATPAAPTSTTTAAPATQTTATHQPSTGAKGGRGGRGHRQESTAGTGSHLLNMRERKVTNENKSSNTPANTSEEFNFEAGLLHFKKEEIFADVAATNAAEVKPKYNKEDFFDSFSAEKSDGRLSASQERFLNQDTFGAIALQANRRPGGRGGRGSGRFSGRGRGPNNGAPIPITATATNATNTTNNNGGRGGRGNGGRSSGRGRGGSRRVVSETKA